MLPFWQRLARVKRLSLRAISHSNYDTGWNRKGQADVLVLRESDTTLIFQERGAWLDSTMSFSNALRWRLDETAGLISLEHLHLGPNTPVFLFHLAPTEKHLLSSVESHLCGNDAYAAQVIWDEACIHLSWRIVGPRKNEEIECHYF